MGRMAKVVLIGTLGIVVGITAMTELGSNLEGEFAAQAAVEPTVGTDPAAPVVVPAPSDAQRPIALARGETMLEQAILDGFPAAMPTSAKERKHSTNARALVGLAINAKGHLCAEAMEAQQAAPGQYGIGCVMNRNGTGAAIYLLDARTGSVTPIG